MSISTTDSKAITLLRFPLAVVIVFAHVNPNTTFLRDTTWDNLSVTTLFHAIETSISYVIAPSAVPCFFLISGFLFFIGLQKWEFHRYTEKLKKRITTLLLPYICWNIISIISFIVFFAIKDFRHNHNYSDTLSFLSSINLHTFWDCKVWGAQKINWLGYPDTSSGPFVGTLWFLRDLIVVCLSAPVLWIMFKFLKKWGLFFLLFCYITKIWISIPGFGIEAFFFFGIGAFIAIRQKSLTDYAQKHHRLFYILALFSFLSCVYYGGRLSTIGYLIFPFCAIGLVGSMVYWAKVIVEKKKWTISPILTQSCMFIYAFHALPIARVGSLLAFIGYNVSKILGSIPGSQLLTYFISPITTIIVCLICHYIILQLSPTIYKCLTGKNK